MIDKEFSEFFKNGKIDSKTLETIRILKNNKPIDDFCSLSSNEMHNLLYDLYTEDCPIIINPNLTNEIIDKVPFYRICEDFLHIVKREEKLKLTEKGFLQRKILEELYSKKYILEESIELGYIKAYKEEDVRTISTAKIITHVAKLITKTNKEIALTRQGNELIKPENKTKLFKRILLAYTEDYNWSYNDNYAEIPVGQFGVGYTFYLLKKFGNSFKSMNFYFEHYIKAFPQLYADYPDDKYSPKERIFKNCYKLRTIKLFLIWFGLIDKSADMDEIGYEFEIKKSEIFDKILIEQ